MSQREILLQFLRAIETLADEAGQVVIGQLAEMAQRAIDIGE